MNNSLRFIEAYNIIDKTLRSQYSIKANIGFSEVVRQTASRNSIVRKFEDELFSYGRLRNAIVHNITDTIIAEPHDEVVERIVHIADMLTSPPKVKDVLKQKTIVSFTVEQTLYDVIEAITKYNYSNIPIYQDDKITGVLNSKVVLVNIGFLLKDGETITYEKLKSIKLKEVPLNDDDHYVFAAEDIDIIEALSIFYGNPRLKAIMLTRDGTRKGPVTSIITSSNIITFGNILDKI